VCVCLSDVVFNDADVVCMFQTMVAVLKYESVSTAISEGGTFI